MLKFRGDAPKVHEKTKWIQHVVQAAFCGRRIAFFSGGAARGDNEMYQSRRNLSDSGGFGSTSGCNTFQREREPLWN